VTAQPARIARVLVCDDSSTYAAGLRRLLERDRLIEVVGICETAERAIAQLAALKPDLVTMDLELPGMSGLEAVEQIMSSAPVPILVLSGRVEHRSETALAALAAGALDAMSKSAFDLRDPDGPAAQTLRHRVKMLSHARVIRHPRARLGGAGAEAVRSPGRSASVIGICASAGGPAALATLLGSLPASFPIPVLVVQHIASGFVEGFARWLASRIELPVRLASAGPPPLGVSIAPDEAHLVLAAGGQVALDDRPPAGPELHRPSGDALLASIAAEARQHAVAVVLTGMGRDGAAGLADVRSAGGLTIAQDEASSAVFGMPRAAAEQGAELVLPLGEIGRRLLRLESRRLR
jgi:two-component system chemotaxis response regulator CheB